MALFVLFLTLLEFQDVTTQSCQWTHGTQIGQVEAPIVEDSGLAISRRFPDRLYHVNDSGDTGRFFITDFSGRNLRIVNVNAFAPEDAEDMAIGPCGAPADCIFIGDIGDNLRLR